jgi:nucleoside-diphosphate-sugar epimerase
VFNIVDDDPAAANDWLPYLAECAGAKRPVHVPRWLARPLAGEVAVIMMTEGRGFSNTRAKQELGWRLRYPSWREGFKAALSLVAVEERLDLEAGDLGAVTGVDHQGRDRDVLVRVEGDHP